MMSKCVKMCPWISHGLDEWTDGISVVCHSLGTATVINIPDGWQEGDMLPDCEIDLGINNPYCPYYRFNLRIEELEDSNG